MFFFFQSAGRLAGSLSSTAKCLCPIPSPLSHYFTLCPETGTLKLIPKKFFSLSKEKFLSFIFQVSQCPNWSGQGLSVSVTDKSSPATGWDSYCPTFQSFFGRQRKIHLRNGIQIWPQKKNSCSGHATQRPNCTTQRTVWTS